MMPLRGTRIGSQRPAESANRKGDELHVYETGNELWSIRHHSSICCNAASHCAMVPELVDVVICGSGSAGISAALWLAKLGVSFRLLEARSGRLEIGRADGVHCRTVEIFESFRLAEALLREFYHVLELAFWSQTADGRLSRAG